ncbi:MAG: TlpA disulfide reductase family protein [Xanthomonadales bacterium]|nr:TlpA disulfide reductase family protein [Xanthomonadales bacterium]
MRPRRLLVILAALAAGLVGYALGTRAPLPPWPAAPVGASGLSLGSELPDPLLADLAGRPRRLSEWRGVPLLINFWASWCAPCVEELPLLAEFDRAHPELTVLAIALDEPEAAAALLARLGLGELTALAGGAAGFELSRRLGNRFGALPFSALVDREFRLRERRLGPLDRRTLEDWQRRVSP